MGTEKAQGIYYAIEKYLQENGVEMYFGYECSNLILENDVCKGVSVSNGKVDMEIYAKHTVVATGRRGADWLEKLCAEHNIAHAPGTVDIGVRVEVRNEVMETVNRVLYESKLVGYPRPFKNKVRTFCQNPGGFVSQENYDNNLAVVNGHSYKEVKSDNTNLSILCSHNFSVPFNQPIAYAQKVGELTNTYISVTPLLRFNWVEWSGFVTMYSKVAVGMTFIGDSYSAEPGCDYSVQSKKQHYFGYQVSPVGVMVGRRLSGFAEVGFGTHGLAQLGLAYRF